MVMLSLWLPASSFAQGGNGIGMRCAGDLPCPFGAGIYRAPRWSVTCGGVCEETEGQSDKKDVTVLKKEEKQ